MKLAFKLARGKNGRSPIGISRKERLRSIKTWNKTICVAIIKGGFHYETLESREPDPIFKFLNNIVSKLEV